MDKWRCPHCGWTSWPLTDELRWIPRAQAEHHWFHKHDRVPTTFVLLSEPDEVYA